MLLATWRQTAGPDLTLGKLIKMESRGPFLHLLLRDGERTFFAIVFDQATYIRRPRALLRRSLLHVRFGITRPVSTDADPISRLQCTAVDHRRADSTELHRGGHDMMIPAPPHSH